MHHLPCGGKKSVLEKQQLKIARLRILGRKREKGEEIGNQIVKKWIDECMLDLKVWYSSAINDPNPNNKSITRQHLPFSKSGHF